MEHRTYAPGTLTAAAAPNGYALDRLSMTPKYSVTEISREKEHEVTQQTKAELEEEIKR